MDIFVVLATMFICFVIGVPIAYSLALAAIAGAFYIGLPLEALMLKISDGVSKVAMLTIPFFVLAGAIMAEGGMARRLVAFADVLVGVTRVRGGLSVVNVLATTFLSGISGSSVAASELSPDESLIPATRLGNFRDWRWKQITRASRPIGPLNDALSLRQTV